VVAWLLGVWDLGSGTWEVVAWKMVAWLLGKWDLGSGCFVTYLVALLISYFFVA
jgi:hypothetical protein